MKQDVNHDGVCSSSKEMQRFCGAVHGLHGRKNLDVHAWQIEGGKGAEKSPKENPRQVVHAPVKTVKAAGLNSAKSQLCSWFCNATRNVAAFSTMLL